MTDITDDDDKAICQLVQTKAVMLSFRDTFVPFLMKWVKCCLLAGVDWSLVQRSLAVEALIIASTAHIHSGGSVASFMDMASTAIKDAHKERPEVLH